MPALSNNISLVITRGLEFNIPVMQYSFKWSNAANQPSLSLVSFILLRSIFNAQITVPTSLIN
jgi:hypothetical protein